MALKHRYEKKEEIPAELASLYTEKGGGFELEVEGQVATKDLQVAEARLAEALIEDGTLSAAAAFGMKATAAEDVRARARQAMRIEGGEVVVTGADGAKTTREAWLGGLKASAPHLFEGNTGGGAAGVPAGRISAERAYTGTNPYKKGRTYSVTRQMAIRMSDPQLADRLEAAAEASAV